MTGNDYALVLQAGQRLSRRAVSSPNGEYVVAHQHDGDVVLYRNADAAALWATGTVFQPDVHNVYAEPLTLEGAYGRPGHLVLQDDGDLVVLSATGERLWMSGTVGRGVTSLMIHDWGKLVLRDGRGQIVWQTERAPRRWDGWNVVADGRRLRRGQTLRGQTLTSDNGRYALVTTFDGVVYLCRADGPVLWAVFGSFGDGLELTARGRLVSRSPEGISRAGNSIGVPPDLDAAEFFVSDQGRLTLVDGEGQVLWTGPAAPTVPSTPPAPR